jgi:hypothetical protein
VRTDFTVKEPPGEIWIPENLYPPQPPPRAPTRYDPRLYPESESEYSDYSEYSEYNQYVQEPEPVTYTQRYQQPLVYQEPEPVYQEPVYPEPVYTEPVYTEPVYTQPVYQEPTPPPSPQPEYVFEQKLEDFISPDEVYLPKSYNQYLQAQEPDPPTPPPPPSPAFRVPRESIAWLGASDQLVEEQPLVREIVCQ